MKIISRKYEWQYMKLIGSCEMDQCFACIPQYPSLQHFGSGLSVVMQWTGNEAQAVAKVFLGMIAGDIPEMAVEATHAVLDFTFQACQPQLDEDNLTCLDNDVRVFHETWEIFRTHEVYEGEDFNNFAKMHMMGHYAHQIREWGVPDGYSTEAPEQMHIDYVKTLYHTTSGVNPEPQMTKHLQHIEALGIRQAKLERAGVIEPRKHWYCPNGDVENLSNDSEDELELTWPRGEVNVDAEWILPRACDQAVYQLKAEMSIAQEPTLPIVPIATIVKDYGAAGFLESLRLYLEIKRIDLSYIITQEPNFGMYHKFALVHPPLPFAPLGGLHRELVCACPTQYGDLGIVMNTTSAWSYNGSRSIQDTGAGLPENATAGVNIESLPLLVSNLFGFGLISVAQVYQYISQLIIPSSTSSTGRGLSGVCSLLEAHGRDLNATPWEGEMERLLEWAQAVILDHAIYKHIQRRMRAVTLSLGGSRAQESLAELDRDKSFQSPESSPGEGGSSGNNYGSHIPAHELGVGSSIQPAETPGPTELKVAAMLNKLEAGDFDDTSDKIIEWVNKAGWEEDGRTLKQTVKLVYERARNNEVFGEMYARLCRKMMERDSPNIQDETIKNSDGQPITGGMLFRKYLLNRCQEDFERGWNAKEVALAAAALKAGGDKAAKAVPENGCEAVLYSPECYAAAKAKRQGLGLVRFIGELFKLQMLTERIAHECIKKLLSNVVNPEEEEIESLCKLLTTVGQSLDNPKARNHMDIYFERMQGMAKSNNINSRIWFVLVEVINLRARQWQPPPMENLAPALMTEREARKKVKEDINEYLSLQSPDEAIVTPKALPSEYRHLFVDRLINAAMNGGNKVVYCTPFRVPTLVRRQVNQCRYEWWKQGCRPDREAFLCCLYPVCHFS
ncbi:hypothetical protein RSAG8_12519, partial [Rhizoctonia solani AG-8 WAC10335]